MATIKRSESDSTFSNNGSGDQKEAGAGTPNLNIQWVHFRLSGVAYIAAIVVVWFVCHSSQAFDNEECWTITNVIHGIISFAILHWVKGSPDEATQGAYDHLTLYEQIEFGQPWTATKKFLMLVPSILTYLACYTAKFKPYPIIVNCGIFLIMIIAKIPEMHSVRIFGINSTPGIDQAINPDLLSSGKKRK